MSHIIEQNHLSPHVPNLVSDSPSGSEYYFYEKLKLFLEKFYCNRKSTHTSNNIVLEAELVVQKTLPSLYLSITLDLAEKKVNTSFVMSYQGLPLSGCFKHHRIQFMREYAVLSQKLVPPSFLLCMNPESGIISGRNVGKTTISKEYLNFYCQTLAHLHQYAELITYAFNDSINFFPKFSQQKTLPSLRLKPNDRLQ